MSKSRYQTLKPLIREIEYPRNLLAVLPYWDSSINISTKYAYTIAVDSIMCDPDKLGTLEYVICKSLSENEQIVIHGIFRDKLNYAEIRSNNITRCLNSAIRILNSDKNKELITLGIEKFYREYPRYRYQESDRYDTINIISKPCVIEPTRRHDYDSIINEE